MEEWSLPLPQSTVSTGQSGFCVPALLGGHFFCRLLTAQGLVPHSPWQISTKKFCLEVMTVIVIKKVWKLCVCGGGVF